MKIKEKLGSNALKWDLWHCLAFALSGCLGSFLGTLWGAGVIMVMR